MNCISPKVFGIIILSFLIGSVSNGTGHTQQIGGSVDIIPDSVTAEKIAEAIFVAHYGKFVLDQKPFNVELLGDSLWVVNGVRQKPTPGGCARIEIRKRDGKVLKLIHGK